MKSLKSLFLVLTIWISEHYIPIMFGLAIIYFLLGAGWAICLYSFRYFSCKFCAVALILLCLSFVLLTEAIGKWRKIKAPSDK